MKNKENKDGDGFPEDENSSAKVNSFRDRNKCFEIFVSPLEI